MFPSVVGLEKHQPYWKAFIGWQCLISYPGCCSSQTPAQTSAWAWWAYSCPCAGRGCWSLLLGLGGSRLFDKHLLGVQRVKTSREILIFKHKRLVMLFTWSKTWCCLPKVRHDVVPDVVVDVGRDLNVEDIVTVVKGLYFTKLYSSIELVQHLVRRSCWERS